MASLTIFSTAQVEVGSWISLPNTPKGTSAIPYLSTNITANTIDLPSVVFFPQLTISGNYSVSVSTPSCIPDDSCALRGVANVTSVLDDGQGPTTVKVAQSDAYARFDQVYYGYVVAASDSFRPAITMRPVTGQSTPLNFVAQRARFELVWANGTNSSSSPSSSLLSAVSSATSASSQRSTSQTSAISSNPTGPSRSSNRLPASTITGFTIGGVAVLALLVIATLLLLRHRRRRRAARTTTTTTTTTNHDEEPLKDKPELPGEGYHIEKSAGEIYEIGDAGAQELEPGNDAAHEVQAVEIAHEIDSRSIERDQPARGTG